MKLCRVFSARSWRRLRGKAAILSATGVNVSFKNLVRHDAGQLGQDARVPNA
jgi:hypothetical protein